MTKRIVTLALLAMLFVFVGCAGMQGAKSITDMTPKEKSAWMMKVYNSSYEDYKVQAAMADSLTDEAKDILREKKKVLTEVWPLIKTYNGYVDTGAIPDKIIEEKIISLLNILLVL